MFTDDKGEKNIHLYEKLGYKKFKTETLSDKVTLVYLEMNCFMSGWSRKGCGRSPTEDET